MSKNIQRPIESGELSEKLKHQIYESTFNCFVDIKRFNLLYEFEQFSYKHAKLDTIEKRQRNIPKIHELVLKWQPHIWNKNYLPQLEEFHKRQRDRYRWSLKECQLKRFQRNADEQQVVESEEVVETEEVVESEEVVETEEIVELEDVVEAEVAVEEEEEVFEDEEILEFEVMNESEKSIDKNENVLVMAESAEEDDIFELCDDIDKERDNLIHFDNIAEDLVCEVATNETFYNVTPNITHSLTEIKIEQQSIGEDDAMKSSENWISSGNPKSIDIASQETVLFSPMNYNEFQVDNNFKTSTQQN